MLDQQINKIRGIDSEVDNAIDVSLSIMADAAVTCREWSDKLNSFSVLPRSRGDIETENESVEKLVEECKKLRDIVNDNVKSISASIAMKRQSEVDLTARDAALTRQYVADGYKLTDETLKRFDLTYHGARLRLIESGIWRANRHE